MLSRFIHVDATRVFELCSRFAAFCITNCLISLVLRYLYETASLQIMKAIAAKLREKPAYKDGDEAFSAYADRPNKEGVTPFLLASSHNKPSMASFLARECGADVAARSARGPNALHYAAIRGTVYCLSVCEFMETYDRSVYDGF